MREPAWLTEALVTALHEELIARYGGHGGLRDQGLLASALARPRNLLAYGEPGLERLAASYAFGLAKNHPFVDGNKLVALAAIDVFLQLNGHELVVGEPEAVVIMRELASSEIDEPELAAWIAANVERLSDD